jgi:predicted HTH domain antitoxin
MESKAGSKEERLERALTLFVGGGLTFGAAAELAGITISELAVAAYARGLEPRYSPETVAEELGAYDSYKKCPKGAKA